MLDELLPLGEMLLSLSGCLDGCAGAATARCLAAFFSWVSTNTVSGESLLMHCAPKLSADGHTSPDPAPMKIPSLPFFLPAFLPSSLLSVVLCCHPLLSFSQQHYLCQEVEVGEPSRPRLLLMVLPSRP